MRNQIPQRLLNTFEAYFRSEAEQWLQERTTCERCHKAMNPKRLSVFFPEADPLDVAKEYIIHSTGYLRKTALRSTNRGKAQFDAILNQENYLVQKVLAEFHHAPHVIVCGNCVHSLEKELRWKKLQSTETTETELRHVLRTLVRKGNPTEIRELCELLNPHITLQLRKIPPYIRNLWYQLEYIIRALNDNKIGHEYVSRWMDQWLNQLIQHDMMDSALGHRIVQSIYRLNDDPLSERLFRGLISSSGNLFTIFRNLTLLPLNPILVSFLASLTPQSQNASGNGVDPHDLQQKLEITLHALLLSRQKSYIHKILLHFFQFSEPIQKIIIYDLWRLDSWYHRKQWSPLVKSYLHIPVMEQEITESIPDQEIIQDEEDLNFADEENEDLSEEIIPVSNLQTEPDSLHSVSTEISAFLRDQDQQLDTELAQYQKVMKLNQDRMLTEIHQVQSLYKAWEEKRGPSPYQMDMIQKELITKYRSVIAHHVKTYETEFRTFFSQYPKSLIAFDVEEWRFQMFCVLGVRIDPDLRIFVKVLAVDDIYPVTKYHKMLLDRMRAWLKEIPSTLIISHGNNPEEVAIIQESGHLQVNTQNLLHEARFLNYNYCTSILGEGLIDFERFLDFHRLHCGVLKHDIPISTFYQLAILSMDHHFTKTLQRKCEICTKDQDVLCYCLEDAFSSMLIFVYFSNHEPLICKRLGYQFTA